MIILYLGKQSRVVEHIALRDQTIFQQGAIDFEEVEELAPNLIVSYGYKHILSKRIVEKYRCVNLHISYLPWNRGVHPNIWSFVQNGPKGVSIHEMTEKVDSGPVIIQELVRMTEDETFRSSYNKLSDTIEYLFIENWNAIRNNDYKGYTFRKEGTYHSQADADKILATIPSYDIQIRDWKLVNEIQDVRKRNNVNWMNLVKLAFSVDRRKAIEIFKSIQSDDKTINDLFNKFD